MFFINGKSPQSNLRASSPSNSATSSRLPVSTFTPPSPASSCRRMSDVSSVKNRMRPRNLIWSGRLSIGSVIGVPCFRNKSNYNLRVIKPLAGNKASKQESGGKLNMKSLIRKFAVAGFLLALSLASFTLGKSVPAFGLVAFAQETDDQVKIDMYKKFVDNRIPNPRVAYQAARDYLQKYSKEKDQYTDYLQKWVLFYERDDRKLKLPVLIYNDKNFAEAYRTGAQVLADEPNYLRAQIDLGYAGYLATSEKNEAFNADALGYAHKAIQALESGKTPADWAPFKGKDDTLAYLYYTVGSLNLT